MELIHYVFIMKRNKGPFPGGFPRPERGPFIVPLYPQTRINKRKIPQPFG